MKRSSRLGIGEQELLAHPANGYLALVDVESYRSFAGESVDDLDMMQHLHGQMTALTAMAWGTPDGLVQSRMIVTGDHTAAERLAQEGNLTSVAGWVRTSGKLCLTSHGRLFDCAHDARRTLLKGRGTAAAPRPWVLEVPPGLFSVLVFYHVPPPDALRPDLPPPANMRSGGAHFSVVLRHYEPEKPRLMPVRLGSLIPWAGEEASSRPWGGAQAA